MVYIGPPYTETIVLPGMSKAIDPLKMSSNDISILIQAFPHLTPYFETGENSGGGEQNTNCCTELYNSIQSEMNKVATNISQIQVNF